jgi:CO/xanthine dehydrogenase Mo-binding subunit
MSAPERLDGRAKVTGQARYAADLSRPGMLFGAVLRSPVPHALIRSIDTRAARELPGVHAVLVGSDLPPDARVGRNMRDMPVLARAKVRFMGEKVAAVAADTREIAQEAVERIQVEYEEVPAVFEPLEAMRPGAPLVHEPADVRAWAVADQVVPDYPNGVSAPAWGAAVEEVERALATADRVFEHTFHTPRQHQVYLEPHACLVEVDAHGIVHIWASNKAPLLLARYLREGVGLTRDRLEIHMLPLGGDFGGKGSFMDIPLAYFLACASHCPVKMVMSYADELAAGNPRHASTIVVRSGVSADGRLVARLFRGYFNSGAYAAFKPHTTSTLPGFRRGAVGPYHVPVQRSEMHMVYTNTVPGGHMRSPGEAQAAYALECHTELIARELGLDPVEFRIRNGAVHPRLDDRTGESGSLPRVREVLEAAASAICLDKPRPPGVGRGVALVEFSTTPGVYSASMRVEPSGQIVLQTPIIENGAGMLTVFRQIVAEEFGVPLDQVSVEQSIEDVEVDRGVGGSRTTRMAGKLAIGLVQRVQQRLADLLAAELGLPSDALRPAAGGFAQADGRAFELSEATSLLSEPLVERMTFRATQRDRGVVFLAQAAEVEVDAETGAVKTRRVASVHEVGRVVNPLLFETQIEGGALQGLGYAVMEGLEVEEGRVTTGNLHEYRVPTMADLPEEFESVLLPPDPSLGLTPVGEGPNAGLAPAIANAVVDVIGPHPLDIPLDPATIRRLAYAKTGQSE